MRENHKLQDSNCGLQCVFLNQKSNIILWPIHTFWYKGSAKNKDNSKVRENKVYQSKKQPETQSVIKQKARSAVARLLLARYDIILNM